MTRASWPASRPPSARSHDQNLFARLWHWRYELGLIAGGLLGAVTIGYTLGLDWLIAAAAAALAILATAMTWPPARQALMARAWCVITPHRVRTGCTHAWIQTRDGRLPVVLYTVPADFGERVWLWCRAGITAGDLEAAREILPGPPAGPATSAWWRTIAAATSSCSR